MCMLECINLLHGSLLLGRTQVMLSTPGVLGQATRHTSGWR
jgi:hypothetical protein